jgi:hypothetical protein
MESWVKGFFGLPGPLASQIGYLIAGKNITPSMPV